MKKTTADDLINKFEAFTRSQYVFRVIKNRRYIFSSSEGGLRPIIKAIIKKNVLDQAIVFDKIVGLAAAKLLIYGRAAKVMACFGSQEATKVLKKNNIDYKFINKIPMILDQKMADPCPYEKLAKGKAPKEFYKLLEQI